jgi:hypothetical protein
MLKPANPTVLAKPISLLAEFSKQAHNYTRVVIWLVYEAFRGHIFKLAAALGTNVLSITAQMGAIGAIYGYARLMQRHAPLNVPYINLTIDPGQPGILWAVVGVSALMFLASGLFQYLSRLITFRMAEENFAESIRTLIVLEGRLPDPRAPMASRMLVFQGFSKILAGSRRGALMALIFFNACVGALGAVAALAVLFSMDPLLTVLILAGVVIGALALYPTTLRGVRFAKLRERTQTVLNNDIRELQLSGLSAERGQSLESPAAYAAAYIQRRKIVAEFTLVTGIAVTVILTMVVYYMATRALHGKASWAIFLAYIGALRMVLSGSNHLIRAFAGVSRFYHQIVPHYAVARDCVKLDKSTLATVSHGETVYLGPQANGNSIFVKAGDRIAVATTDLRRYVQFAMMEAKVRSSGNPIGTTIVRSGACLNDRAIVVIELNQLSDDDKTLLSPDGPLRDKVALFLHPTPGKVGTFGETDLLTTEDGVIERFVPLGTSESDLILKELAAKAAKRAQRALADEEEEEEEDDL